MWSGMAETERPDPLAEPAWLAARPPAGASPRRANDPGPGDLSRCASVPSFDSDDHCGEPVAEVWTLGDVSEHIGQVAYCARHAAHSEVFRLVCRDCGQPFRVLRRQAPDGREIRDDQRIQAALDQAGWTG